MHGKQSDVEFDPACPLFRGCEAPLLVARYGAQRFLSTCAIGFGISTPEQAAKMAGIVDGAIVGSAIIKLLEQYGTAAPEQIGTYVKRMKDAVHG